MTGAGRLSMAVVVHFVSRSELKQEASLRGVFWETDAEIAQECCSRRIRGVECGYNIVVILLLSELGH